MRSKGRELYELSVKTVPNYHDGTPRKTWDELSDVEKWSWDRPIVVITAEGHQSTE